MNAIFRTTRRVEFRDTDAAGIAHFSAFFLYMEQVEHEFLRSLGLSVMTSDADGPISWPRRWPSAITKARSTSRTCSTSNCRSPDWATRASATSFALRNSARDVAVGRLTAVCCRMEPTGARAIIIPDWIRSKLAPWQPAP